MVSERRTLRYERRVMVLLLLVLVVDYADRTLTRERRRPR
jgi:hypothetical protein